MTVVPFPSSNPNTWGVRIGKVKLKVANNLARFPSDFEQYEIDPTMTLAGALEANLCDVVVLGYDEDGETYFASSTPDGAAILLMMERAKLEIMNVAVRKTKGPTTA